MGVCDKRFLNGLAQRAERRDIGNRLDFEFLYLA